jgi:hypothetical protein
MVYAVDVAQIPVNGCGDGAWKTDFFIAFSTFYDLWLKFFGVKSDTFNIFYILYMIKVKNPTCFHVCGNIYFYRILNYSEP